MIAIAASVLLAAYLIFPELLFRLLSGRFVPLRAAVRTRAEEVYRALVTTAVPLLIAYVLVWSAFPFNTHPFEIQNTAATRNKDYRIVVGGLYSEQLFKDYGDVFWGSLTRVSRRQARLLFWYYALVAFEALAIGNLASSYGTFKKNRAYAWLADRLLFPKIQEWHVLLTPFVFADKRTVVRADVLTTADTLYSGTISEHFLDKDGRLTGIILTEARRFDRRTYLQDKDAGKGPKPDAYWRSIPGARLYIFAEKIVNLNLNYESPAPPEDVVAKYIEKMLKRQFPTIQVNFRYPEKPSG